jgi:hypothetical protein
MVTNATAYLTSREQDSPAVNSVKTSVEFELQMEKLLAQQVEPNMSLLGVGWQAKPHSKKPLELMVINFWQMILG